MNIKELQLLFEKNKETSLFGRYITNEDIKPLFNKKASKKIDINAIGKSVLGDDIYSIKLGSGPKKILMWSQMHGNESTTTKAIFDFINTCISGSHITEDILVGCTILIVPILNPDGAKAYTRVNANLVDLNRDAQNLTQPESVVLRNIFKSFKPDFCFNLHGQRTIFSAGNKPHSATVSFLAPAQDENCTITANRKIAMAIIAKMNDGLQKIIPNQVGTYDDDFNLNCVGDTFQSKNVPTILFEAGHYKNDYFREKTRELIYVSYIIALSVIAIDKIDPSCYEAYLKIPENQKLFFDVIIRNAKHTPESEDAVDIAFQFEERLIDGLLKFVPIVSKIERLNTYFAHREIDANMKVVSNLDDKALKINDENVFVKINNEKIALFSK
ncbi:MAG: M14 family zinc carboxypeptidase [Jejuia sp.]